MVDRSCEAAAVDFVWQWADASIVTASKEEWESSIPMTPPVTSLVAPVIPRNSSAPGPCVPADIFMSQEPASCIGKPTQHSIVQTAVAETVLKGVTPLNRTRIRMAATTPRATFSFRKGNVRKR